MVALKDDLDSTSLTAIKEILDREEGKVTEKKEFTHRLAQLPDEEVDALLISATTADDGPEQAPTDEGTTS
jgi:hypothetical protein